jgi:hypothetical protein
MKTQSETRDRMNVGNCPKPTTTRVYLALGQFDRRRGQRYNCHLASLDGEQIVTDALDVEFAACRVLNLRGIGGRLEVWRHGSCCPSMIITDIEKAAEWTVREDATRSPSIVPYRQFPGVRTSKSKRGAPSKVATANNAAAQAL